MDSWIISHTYELSKDVLLETGVTFRCIGERGRTYKFVKAVTNGAGETWIDCFGGASGYGQSRSVSPDRINPASVKRPKKKVE